MPKEHPGLCCGKNSAILYCSTYFLCEGCGIVSPFPRGSSRNPRCTLLSTTMNQFLDRYRVFLMLIGIVITGFTLFSIYQVSSQLKAAPIVIEQCSSNGKEAVTVDISGGVITPGLYEVPRNSLVYDVVEKSGGFSKEANLEVIEQSINLAAYVDEEMKIYIPIKQQESVGNDQTEKPMVININTASKTELMELPGIGESYAQRIIDGRPYAGIEDIMNVKGIGESTFNEIKDKITI